MPQGDSSEQMLSNGHSADEPHEAGPKNPATAALEAAKAVNAGQPVDAVPEAPKA